MKSKILKLAAHVLALAAMSAPAAVHYVNVNSASPAPPYTDWATAATTIQAAVDAAVAGDEILVTNGVYQTGGQVVSEAGTILNRVAVTKPLMVRSVNGAAVTVIHGQSTTRCVYLTNGAALAGFTLTSGFAVTSGSEGNGGGIWCPAASVSNCVLTANSAGQGGGAYGGTLNNCTLTGNSSVEGDTGGGGAYGCTLNHCLLTGNSAFFYGGGAYLSTLNNCTLSGNSAGGGGGASDSTLNNCILSANSAGGGGGTYYADLNNCSLTANSASYEGGGAYAGTLNNCIVYYNSSLFGDNYSGSILSYSCTTPLPVGGVGNISVEPQLADFSHLSAGSPCRGAGSAAYPTGLDIDGEPWANPPAIGCDEYHPGAVTGPLSVSIQAAYTNVTVGFAVNFTAATDGHATASQWEFGDGRVLSNRPSASHSWAMTGDYSVVLQAYNETNPGGISATVTVHVVAQPVHYVAVGSAHPVSPYSSWATAANAIQNAVDAASVAGALVLVADGVYRTGERMVPEAGTILNRVAVTKPLMVRSVNGAAVTVIHGQGTVRCIYLTNGAALAGFTLTNGFAEQGGGVWCASAGVIVSNCVLTANSAGLGGGAAGGTLFNCSLTANSANYGGGGADYSTLNNCTLTANSAPIGGGAEASTLNNCTLSANFATNNYYGDGGGAAASTLNNCTLTGNLAHFGGGALESTLNNCTITGNSATAEGGGAYFGILNNCIIYYNSAPNGANYSGSFLSYSCTTPLPTNGIGNLASAPRFVDYSGGNLRLQSNSPCINVGSNASAPDGPDLDGNPRIAGGTVDIGAYEFQAPRSGPFDAWLQQYGLPTDGSADYTDPDADGMNNWQEWRAGTNPTNALSVLRLLSPASGAPGLIVSWQSVSDRNYFLERGASLGAVPAFVRLTTNIVGQPGTTIFTDTNAIGAGPFFYRVGVQD